MTNRFFVFMPVVVLGLGALAITGMREQFVMQPVRPLASIAPTMLGLNGRDVPIAEEEQKVAGMSHFVLRDFRRDSTTTFSVYVGYYDRQVQGKTIHSPKNCLPGAGWEILDASKVALSESAKAPLVNRVLLSNRGARALVYYWYQGRGRIEASEYRVKWDLMRDAALYGRTEEALVRVVVPMGVAKPGVAVQDDSDYRAADILARRIAVSLADSVMLVLPHAPGA